MSSSPPSSYAGSPPRPRRHNGRGGSRGKSSSNSGGTGNGNSDGNGDGSKAKRKAKSDEDAVHVASALDIALSELRDEEGRIKKEIELEKSISSCGVLPSVQSNSGLQTQLQSLQMARTALETQLAEATGGKIDGADDGGSGDGGGQSWFDNL